MTFSERITAAAHHNNEVFKAEEIRSANLNRTFRRSFYAIGVIVVFFTGKAVLFPGEIDYRPAILTATQNVVWCRQQTPYYQSLSYCTGQEKKLDQLWEWDEAQRIKNRK